MERAVKEKNFVKRLKNPKQNIQEEESDDLGLNFCPKRKKKKEVKNYNFIEAYDTHIPIKKWLINE